MVPERPTPSIEPSDSQALLRERLAQLEAALLEARGRVLRSFDRELASIRGWMDSMEHFDPTAGLQAINENAPGSEPALHDVMTGEPHFVPSNVLPFAPSPWTGSAEGGGLGGPIEERPLDPDLANATLDELNAALAAAFLQVAQSAQLQEARSA